MACPFTEEQLQEHFEDFYEDIFTELAKYGEVAELNCCDNLGEHLVGNVYVRLVFFLVFFLMDFFDQLCRSRCSFSNSSYTPHSPLSLSLSILHIFRIYDNDLAF